MKIRADFVSNSSSTSFMLVGQAFDEQDILNAINTRFPDRDRDRDAYGNLCILLNGSELTFERGIERFYDQYVVGLSYNKMKTDETKTQFEERAKTELEKAFPGQTISVGACIDGGYNG